MNWPFQRSRTPFTVSTFLGIRMTLALLIFIVCTSCKEAGDMIENKSSFDVQVVVTTFGGATVRRTISRGTTFALPKRDKSNQWGVSMLEAINPAGRRIGVFNAEPVTSGRHPPYIKIIIYADRLSVSHRN